MAECLSWKCLALPLNEPLSRPTMQLEDQALQLLLLATGGLPGGWAGLGWAGLDWVSGYVQLQNVLGVRTDSKVVLLPRLLPTSLEG